MLKSDEGLTVNVNYYSHPRELCKSKGRLRVKSWKLTLIATALSVSACAGAKSVVLSSGDRYRAGGLATEEYRLGAGDKLRVVVYNEPQLSGDYVVDSQGQLSLPLVGVLDVQGKTSKEVAKAAEDEFRKHNYLLAPRVSVEISAFRPFYIVGEVRKPGEYPYVAGLTVWNAIATAEGLTPRAKKAVVYIRRFGEAAELPYKLTPDLRVWPGDTLRINERFF